MFRNPTTDLIVALVIVLLIFGPKRLPNLGRQLGHGLREFKDSVTGGSNDDEEEARPRIAQSTEAAPTGAAPAGEAAPAAGSGTTGSTPAPGEQVPATPGQSAPAGAPGPESAEIGSQERRG